MGLEPYVSHRLSEASEQVLDICKMSSLLYHFGQQAIPVQLLSSIFVVTEGATDSDGPSDAKFDPRNCLFSRLIEGVRPAHELIANEILEQVLARGLADKRNWRSGLAESAVEFIEYAAQHHDHPGGANSQSRTNRHHREGNPRNPCRGFGKDSSLT